MPWIIALSISFLGLFLNLIIANKQVRANRKLNRNQVNATLNTSNRQVWVTETRNAITDLLTQANLLNIEFQEKVPDYKRRKEIHEKFTNNKNKLFLLLKLGKEKHEFLLNSIKELMDTIDEHLLNSNANNNHGMNMVFNNKKFLDQTNIVIEKGRELLYDEWGKIQSITDKL